MNNMRIFRLGLFSWFKREDMAKKFKLKTYSKEENKREESKKKGS